MDKIAFLVNGTLKKINGLTDKIEKEFKHHNYKIYVSNHEGHTIDLAQEAIEKGYKSIISVGGDGSVNETINGIANAIKKNSGRDNLDYDWSLVDNIRLGVLPFGTGNDFCKTIQVDSSISKLRSQIELDQIHKIDLGFAAFSKQNNSNHQRFFVNITDVGMGGVVVEKLQNKIPILSRKSQYNLAIASTFLNYKKSIINIESDTFSYEGKVMNLIIANGKYFGSGLGIAPDAKIDDGKFSIVILGDINILDYLKNLNEVKKCNLLEHPQVHYHSCKEIKIKASDGRSLPIDMDGEFIGYAPLNCVNITKAINVYM